MKKIIISLVVLLGLGGGVYYTQASGLYDLKSSIPSQVMDYIPTSVKDLMGIEENIESTEVVSTPLDELDNTDIQPLDIPLQQAMMGDNTIAANDETASQSAMGIQFQQMRGGIDDNGVMMGNPSRQEVQVQRQQQHFPTTNASIASQVPEKTPTPVRDVQVLDASPEEMKMVNKLNKLESKIVKLDNENEDLQTRYSNMLKQNRELALKIKDIDHRIKSIDAQ